MSFVLTGALCYRHLGSESIVYKVDTAETLLLERRAANILEAIPSNAITVSQLEERVAMGIELDPEGLSLDEVLSHLVAAGLIKEVA